MAREELAAFTRRLAMLGADGLDGVYRTAHQDARLHGQHSEAVRLQPGGGTLPFTVSSVKTSRTLVYSRRAAASS